MLVVLLAAALTVTTPEEAVVLLAADAPPPPKEVFEAAAEAEPNRSEVQYFCGASVFETISQVGMLGRMRAASKGKAALETAIALDPSNVRARQALFQFYVEAPGIAGGSMDRAREQAGAAMSKAYVAAETANGSGSNPAAAMTSHAFQLIRAKKDPASALPVIERLAKIEKPDEYTADFLRGEAKSALGDCAAAVESYARVLEKQPEARNTRYSMAACLEKLGRRAEAANHYDEFARRFPKDDRAGKAKDQAAKLRKAVVR